MIRQPPRSTRTDTRLPDTSFFRSKRTRDMPDMRWAFDMASMLQGSLVAFMAAGAFLPMSYFDLSYQLMALSAVLAAFCVQQIQDSQSLEVRTPQGSVVHARKLPNAIQDR